MKILYDGQIFDMQRFGGISRYFYKLTKYNQGLYDYAVCGKYCDNVYVSEISDIKPFPLKRNFRGKGRIIRFANEHSNSRAIKTEKYDIFHPTYYSPVVIPQNKPVVITAHDFIHELFPSFFPANDKTSEAKETIFKEASRIIAISATTKNDLLKFFPETDESKIDVVYHAIEWEVCEEKSPNPIGKPYLLYTGTRNSYKNFPLFLAAVAPLLKKYDLCLVCTGGSFSTDENALLHVLGVEARTRHIFADEQTLKALYENALCFVFPSLYEGFGFPILEAFASKCPIAISGASCFPEIAGDAACYFAPYSQDDMRAKIEGLICSETMRAELVRKGIERFGKFTMDAMIRNTLRVYEKAMNSTIHRGGVQKYSVIPAKSRRAVLLHAASARSVA